MKKNPWSHRFEKKIVFLNQVYYNAQWNILESREWKIKGDASSSGKNIMKNRKGSERNKVPNLRDVRKQWQDFISTHCYHKQ